MAHIIVLGGGIGGVLCAYELKQAIRRSDGVLLVSNKLFFQFTPFMAVMWRQSCRLGRDILRYIVAAWSHRG